MECMLICSRAQAYVPFHPASNYPRFGKYDYVAPKLTLNPKHFDPRKPV